MSALRAVLAVARVELLRLRRTRIAFTLLLAVPAMQVILFGYAIRPDPPALSVAVGGATPQAADRLADAVGRIGGLRIVARRLPPGGAEARVRAGDALVGVEAPVLRSFADPMAVPRPLAVHIDASNAALTASAAAKIEAAYWRALAEQAGAQGDVPGLRIERLYNPDGRPAWTFLPALAGVAVMIGMVMLGTLSLARERETGSWEALLVLPISPVQALAGKLLPYVVIGTLQGCLVLAAGAWLFDLPMRGGVGAVVVLLPLFAAAHLVLGYAISARAATQLAALQGAVAFYLPAMLLSGFLYPFETLPGWARTIGAVFPLTHFIRAARGALLRGDGAAATLAHGGPMLLFLGVALVAALLLQARRLD